MSKYPTCTRIELTYADGRREFASGEDAQKILEWWGSCQGMAYIHGAVYDGPKMQQAESDLLDRALAALELDLKEFEEIYVDVSGTPSAENLRNQADRVTAVLREAGRLS